MLILVLRASGPSILFFSSKRGVPSLYIRDETGPRALQHNGEEIQGLGILFCRLGMEVWRKPV